MSFSDDVLRFSEKTLADAERILQIAAEEVFNSLTVGSAVTLSQGTPVGETSFALNSWSVGGTNGPANGLQQIGTMKLGQVREIVGGAIYLRGLEEGRARQRPAGWVRLTIASWPRIVDWAAEQLVNPARVNAPIPGRTPMSPPSSTRRARGSSAGRRKW
jgi:hypothetical protein